MPTFPNFWRPLFAMPSRPLEQEEPAVVQLANGDFWVVWRDRSSSPPGDQPGIDILGQRFDALGHAIG